MWLAIGISLAIFIGYGLYWVLRQRTPDEIRAAREKLREHNAKKDAP